MAGLETCQSSCRNSPLASEDKLTEAAPIKGNNTLTATPATFWAQTPALAVFSIAPTVNSIDELCQQLIKTYAATVKVLEQN